MQILLIFIYSSVPNKHAARLLIFGKKFLPTRSIWSYTFIKFCEIFLSTRLFGPTHLFPRLCKGKFGELEANFGNKLGKFHEFSYIFAIAFQHFPSCKLISPYTFIRSSKKYPPYTFICHYTFINFPKFSLLHFYLALHV